jgi:phosphopantetheinyl transferase
VRKEAVAKGRGEGLGLDLTQIQTRPGVPAEATEVKLRTKPRDRWFVWDVPVGDGGSGAVAARERSLRIELFEFAPAVIDLTALSHLADRAPVASLAP